MSSSSASEITLVSSAKCFDGLVQQYKHQSNALKCEMMFHVFVPAVSEEKKTFPCLIFLSGLTCNDTNFITKAAALEHASKLGIALICPDTSPRGKEVPGAPTPGEWDFGAGAGFYVNATQAPYHEHYRMYDYIAKELPQLLGDNESKLHMDTKRMGIFGHSMGGHGALTIYLKHRNLFKSCSAFAPICHPASPDCAWGQKAFKGYLGTSEDYEVVKHYDACLLMKQYQGPKDNTILIDQGLEDKFLPQKQLQPEAFQKACTEAHYPLILRFQAGYDHSYWFIQTFIKDHLQHHAQYL